MPLDVTLTISDAHLAKLQAWNTKLNSRFGTALTLKERVMLLLKEAVLAEDISTYASDRKTVREREANDNLETDILTEKNRLMGLL